MRMSIVDADESQSAKRIFLFYDLPQYQLDELVAIVVILGVSAALGPLSRLPDGFDDVSDQFVRDPLGVAVGGKVHTPFNSRDDS